MTISRSLPAHGETHVWYGNPQVLDDPGLAEAYRELLSEQERHREKRFRFDADRQEYSFAHTLLRVLLSEYLGCPPTKLEFAQNQFGKPRLAYPQASGLRFNLSHTPGLAVCAIAKDCEVGVDVERADRDVDELTLAQRYFSESEYELLESAPTTEHRTIFYRLWTLKESFIKAYGVGLSFPLADFAFSIPSDGPPTISFKKYSENRPSDWCFASRKIADHHQAAVSLRVGEPTQFDCRWSEMTPLR
jgi:4'-phosphopantetheinyl transferase